MRRKEDDHLMKGICPNCGKEYYGWALQEEKYQHCGKCGTKLIITKTGYEKTKSNPKK